MPPELSRIDRFARTVRFRRYELELSQIIEVFRHAGIEPILIKGWAASVYYREPSDRGIGDFDLAVAAAELGAAEELIAAKGLLRIDLHRELRHLDTKPWDALVADSRIEMCEGVPVRVPSPEDHLRILATHWLTDGGGYRDKLLDIRCVIENRGEPFDWDRCLGAVSPTRQRWVRTAAGLAVRYCGLDPALLPFAGEVRELPEWITKALEREWASGYRLTPLHFVLGDRRELFRQIRKRIPPNPIQATIETEGEFDEGPRWPYQLRSLAMRIRPSLPRIAGRIFRKK